jgi:hypothetical protein
MFRVGFILGPVQEPKLYKIARLSRLSFLTLSNSQEVPKARSVTSGTVISPSISEANQPHPQLGRTGLLRMTTIQDCESKQEQD